MHAVVLGDRDVRRDGVGELAAVVASCGPGPGEREHRAVVVGVGVHVDERRPAPIGDRAQHREVAAFRDVRHTLEHAARSSWYRRIIASTAMHLGLALPQYDYSVAGRTPAAVRDDRRLRAARGRVGLRLGVAVGPPLPRPGQVRRPPDREGVLRTGRDARGAGARVSQVRLGALVFCEALRPASVLAKALATLDRVCGGRLDVGLGAGWYEPEYDAIGMAMPAPGARLRRLGEAIEVVTGLLAGTPFTFDGAHHRARCAEPAARGPATAAARVRGRQGRSAPATGRRARRRLEHVLDVDARRVPRARRHAGSRV